MLMTEPSRVSRAPAVPAGPSARELSVVGVALAAAVILEVLLSGSAGLLTRIPWLDECLTLLVVNDPSFSHGVAAIRGGVDTTPPGFLTVMWPVARLFGGLTSLELRLFSGLFAIVACVAVYATGRLFVDRQRAALGALVVAIHPGVLVQLFQVRFYTFWLAGTAWLVYFTARQALDPDRRRYLAWRCVLAVVIVTTHWFGVIVLGLITGADFLARRGARQRMNAAVPMIVGVVILGVCYPFLAAQRAGLTVPTWIEPMTVSGLARQLRAFAGVGPMAFLMAAAVYRAVSRDRWMPPAGSRAAQLPALALLLLPAVLVVLSIVMQPVAQARYMLPAVVAIGLLGAWLGPSAAARHGRAAGIASGVVLIVFGAVALRRLQAASVPEVAMLERAIASADSLRSAGVRPVLFLRRAEQYPVLAKRPDLAAATAVVDFEGDGGGLSTMRVYERDMTRRVNRVYPAYALAPRDSLDRLSQFVLLTGPEEEVVPQRLFPQHRITAHGPGVYTAVRR